MTGKQLVQTVLLLLWLTTSWADSARSADTHFFEVTFGDFTEELVRAKEQGKKGLFVFFEQDECPFCHRMKQTVFNQIKVQEYFRKNFLVFSVDIEGQTEVVNFKGQPMTAKKFSVHENRVRATPVLAFFNLRGERIVRYTGATAGTEEFMWLGHFVADGHFKNTSFIQFKRQMRKKSGLSLH